MRERKPHLTALLVTAARAAWAELRATYPHDHVYGFALYTTACASYIAPTAYTAEGLAEVATRYAGSDGDPARAAVELRFSPCDSPRHLLGEAHFDAIQPLLESPRKNEKRCIEACFVALAQLDAEGLFGRGEEREQLVLNVLMGDQSDRSIVENARRLNPPSVMAWFEPHFSSRSNDQALFTLGARGAYQITGLAFAGDSLVAAGSGGELDVFKRDPASEFRQIFNKRGKGTHWACALAPDGLTLYLSDGPRLLARKVGKSTLGQAKLLLDIGVNETIGEIDVSPDGHSILVWSWARLYAIGTTGEIRWQRPRAGRGMAWHPKGDRIVYAADEAVVWLDPATGDTLGTITNIGKAETLTISPEGSKLALAYGGGYFKDTPAPLCEVHSLVDEGMVWRVEANGATGILALRFSPDGQMLAAACGDGTTRVWDVNGSQVLQVRGRQESMSRVLWLDEERVVVAGRDVDRGPSVVAFAVPRACRQPSAGSRLPGCRRSSSTRSPPPRRARPIRRSDLGRFIRGLRLGARVRNVCACVVRVVFGGLRRRQRCGDADGLDVHIGA